MNATQSVTYIRPYSSNEIPVQSYATLMGVYATVFYTLNRLSKNLPDSREPISAPRLALLTIASYKLSRIITMSFIASPIRAPFTRRGISLPAGEVQDIAKGQGLQKAIGNLLTCPFCFSVWSSTLFVFGNSFFPRATLKIAQILSIAAFDDLLHLGFRNLREKSE